MVEFNMIFLLEYFKFRFSSVKGVKVIDFVSNLLIVNCMFLDWLGSVKITV